MLNREIKCINPLVKEFKYGDKSYTLNTKAAKKIFVAFVFIYFALREIKIYSGNCVMSSGSFFTLKVKCICVR